VTFLEHLFDYSEHYICDKLTD